MATKICGCGFVGCDRDARFAGMLEASHAAFEAIDSAELVHVRDQRIAESAKARSAWYDSFNTCSARQDAIRVANEAALCFIDARIATRVTRAKFAQAIALGMAQVYKITQCGATMLCGGGGQ